MNIIQRLIPTKFKDTRPGIRMVPKYLCVHETDNPSQGANAEAHARLQERGNNRQASWHYQVDDYTIIQSIPDDEVAWHAGDGNGPGNLSSIAIEICVNQDGNFEKAKSNAVDLIRYLMKKWGIPIERVVPHKHFSGKDCPRTILKSGWSAFLSQISVETKPAPPPYPGYLIEMGSAGAIVKAVQRKLGGLVIDGIFGVLTRNRVREYQKQNKLVIDGIVGPLTWKKLFG